MEVSIIITCFNLEKYITRAINSCLNQTMDEDKYEIIVVDDHSTDNSWEIINDFSDLITPIRLNKNCGVSRASNVGIFEAKGKFITRVDGDDFVNRNFIKTLYEILRWNEDIGFVYCDHILVNEKKERKQIVNTLDILLDHGAGILFRKRYLETIGLYDEELRNREDYDLILRYIKNFDGYHLRLPYYRYFQRDGSLSSRKLERQLMKNKIDKNLNNTI
tara:strand:- start:147 stop:803 length:657 start_codon:yes stop_codon:yes gene_type:complete